MRNVTLVCFAVALVACKDDAPRPRDRPEPAVTPKRSLPDQLAYEAARRPEAKAVDAVLAAFANASLDVKEAKQYVARTVDAEYCVGGTVAGLAVAVCEYRSPAAASVGREHVMKAVDVPERRIVVKGALTLTTTGPASLDDVRARLERVFGAL